MQLKIFLESKIGTAIELLLFFGVALSTLQVSIIIPVLIGIVIFSLKTRELKYRDIGFIRADFKLKNILAGIGIGIIYLALFYLIEPLISRFTSDHLPEVFNIKQDFPKLLVGLFISWTVAAFGEEILFRGYLIHRLIDLMGEKIPAKILIVMLVGVAFGFVHYYQGSRGVVAAGIFGMFQSIIYLTHRKKLILPIFAHGTFDSIGFVKLFFG